MKTKHFAHLLMILFLISSLKPVFANSDTFTTGKEWEQKMSKGEKFISVYAPMILFHRYGVNFRKTPNEYAETIDKVLLNNPYLEKEDVANIFASTVYAYEPESRPAFHEMEAEFSKEGFTPHLLIRKTASPELNKASEE